MLLTVLAARETTEGVSRESPSRVASRSLPDRTPSLLAATILPHPFSFAHLSANQSHPLQTEEDQNKNDTYLLTQRFLFLSRFPYSFSPFPTTAAVIAAVACFLHWFSVPRNPSSEAVSFL